MDPVIDHPYYHDIDESEAKKLITKESGTFLFCRNKNPRQITLCYGAIFRDNWEIRTMSVDIDVNGMIHMCRCKIPSFSKTGKCLKDWLEGFAVFEIKPILNEKYDLTPEKIIEMDSIKDKKYQELLDTYNYIYHKLVPYVDASSANEKYINLEYGEMRVQMVQHYSMMAFLCVVFSSSEKFVLMVSKNDIHRCATNDSRVGQNVLSQLYDLCKNIGV